MYLTSERRVQRWLCRNLSSGVNFFLNYFKCTFFNIPIVDSYTGNIIIVFINFFVYISVDVNGCPNVVCLHTSIFVYPAYYDLNHLHLLNFSGTFFSLALEQLSRDYNTLFRYFSEYSILYSIINKHKTILNTLNARSIRSIWSSYMYFSFSFLVFFLILIFYIFLQ